jgi:hypothetical protein
VDTIWAALIAAALGPAVAWYALRRSMAQPIPAPVEDEAVVLATVLDAPDTFFKVCLLEPEHFAFTPHRELWAAVRELSVPSEDPDQIAEAAQAQVEARVLELDRDELRAALTAAEGVDEELLDELYGDDAPVADGEEAVLRAGASVLGAGDERVTLEGRIKLVTDPDGGRTSPLRRVQPPLDAARVVSATLACAAGAVGAWTLGDTWLERSALWILAIGCVVLALVDLDTMFIDFVTLVPTTVTAWVFAVPAALRAGGTDRIVYAAVGTVATVAGLELLVRIYSRMRGRFGMGGGDSALLVATLSVPLLVSGDTMVGNVTGLPTLTVHVN